MDANMIGAYGPWAAGLVGKTPARLSFRQAMFQAGEVNAWRTQARERLHACLRPSFNISSSTTACMWST
jgi:hypothetical protein